MPSISSHSLEITLICHLIIQTFWIFSISRTLLALLGFLTVCFLKTTFLSCTSYIPYLRYSRSSVFYLQALIDSLFYILFAVDYRVYRLFGQHVISPMIWVLIWTPADQMRENLDTSSQWDFAPMAVMSVVVVVLVYIYFNRALLHILEKIGRHSRRRYESILTWKSRWSFCVLTIVLWSLFSLEWSSKNLNVMHDAIVDNTGADWCSEVPVMKHRPNIVVVFYDSGRIDQFTNKTFPRMHQLMHEQASDCQLWPHHYSGGVQSDTGHIALLYGIIPTNSNLFKLEGQAQSQKTSPTSWPLEVLKANGYQMRAVSSTNLAYCWAIGQNCSLHRKVFDEYESPPEELSLVERETWAAQRASSLMESHLEEPYFLMVNFEATHYPYSYPPEHETELPVASKDDVWKFIKTGSDDPETSLKIHNRYRNSARYTDSLIHRYILPQVSWDRSLFMLTSDHGEFLTEYGKFGHTIGEFYEEETHVTALFCARPMIERDSTNNNKMPTFDVGTVSTHTDFMVTVLDWSIAGNNNVMSHPLKLSLPGRSLLRPANEDTKPFAFSIYPWSRTVLLTDGQIKLWSDGETVDKLTDMHDTDITKGEREKYGEQIIYLNRQWQELVNLPLPCHKKPSSYLVQLAWLGGEGEERGSKCLDRKTPGKGGLQIYKCWSDGWNQRWTWDSKEELLSMNVSIHFDGSEIKNGRMEHLKAWMNESRAVTKSLHSKSVELADHWTYSEEEARIQWRGHDQCLEVNEAEDVVLSKCDPNQRRQRWKMVRI